MIAIVKIAGKQFKVEKGRYVFVPKLAGQVGDSVDIKDVLLLEDQGSVVVQPQGKVVRATIAEHRKGEKVIAFKMKRRKGFRKKKGHRTCYTRLQIDDIV